MKIRINDSTEINIKDLMEIEKRIIKRNVLFFDSISCNQQINTHKSCKKCFSLLGCTKMCFLIKLKREFDKKVINLKDYNHFYEKIIDGKNREDLKKINIEIEKKIGYPIVFLKKKKQ